MAYRFPPGLSDGESESATVSRERRRVALAARAAVAELNSSTEARLQQIEASLLRMEALLCKLHEVGVRTADQQFQLQRTVWCPWAPMPAYASTATAASSPSSPLPTTSSCTVTPEKSGATSTAAPKCTSFSLDDRSIDTRARTPVNDSDIQTEDLSEILRVDSPSIDGSSGDEQGDCAAYSATSPATSKVTACEPTGCLPTSLAKPREPHDEPSQASYGCGVMASMHEPNSFDSAIGAFCSGEMSGDEPPATGSGRPGEVVGSASASASMGATPEACIGCEVKLHGLTGQFRKKNGSRCKVTAWNADAMKWQVTSSDGKSALMPGQFLKVIDADALERQLAIAAQHGVYEEPHDVSSF